MDEFFELLSKLAYSLYNMVFTGSNSSSSLSASQDPKTNPKQNGVFTEEGRAAACAAA